MMIKTIALTLVSSACVLSSFAQMSEPSRPRLVEALRFSQVNVKPGTDSLRVQFHGLLPARLLKSSAALRLVPRYVTANGDFMFPSVLINGNSRAKFYAREQAMKTFSAEDLPRPAQVIRQRKGEAVHFAYNSALKLPKGATGQLVIDAYIENCCQSRLLAPIALVAGTPTQVPYFFERNVAFFRPKAEQVKARNTNLSVRINFQTAKYELLPHFNDNARELARVDSVLRPMQRKPDLYTITQIRINGYASPEAPATSNARLSQRRADVFRNHVMQQYGLQSLAEFPALGMGEDWTGLRKALLARPIAQQERVLAVLDRTEDYDERERQLRQVDYGHAWRTLLDEYFPPLRRMEMQIAYTVRALALNEAEVMLDGRPQDLSAAELFDVARWRNNDQLLTTHRQYYGREFTIATEHFSQDPYSWLNASTAALLRGEAKVAKHMLDRVGDTPLAYNNLGLYYWIVGDTVRADYYFQLAATVDATKATAEYNLSQLATWQQQRASSSKP